MLVKLADLTVRIENRHAYTAYLCRDYLLEKGTADFVVSVSEADILEEDCGREMPDYAESLAVYRKIAEEILLHDGFLMHGVVIEAHGKGIAFLARSGVGKSTHARLWQNMLGEDMRVINGDKPLIRFIDGQPYAYGTPWAGKEGLQTNARAPLSAVCFLSRGEENVVFPMQKEEVLLSLLPQIYIPKDGEGMGLCLEMLDKLIASTDFYKVRCNMEPEAAAVCYRAIFGKEK